MLDRIRPIHAFITAGLALVLAIATGIALQDLDHQFRESGIVTYTSAALLALTAATSLRIGRLRREGAGWSWRDPRIVWLAIGLGFVWLALDDLAQIHENLDRLLHRLAGIEETPLTDRLDDLIILAYGLIGAGVMWACRSELRRFPQMLGWLATGAALLVLQVAIDALLNDASWVLFSGFSAARPDLAHDLGEILEESVKLLAEAAFLSGFIRARHSLAV
ncbi:hypothetical protein [uncultured Limimaricola sp.]|mgnify:CR=1 FL=1|uniref:hypothetical protein n=1 Tax=uncultured Limimaricola sp. TaxID=2211667 RepID=UPI0030FB6C1D